ncbi:aminotransferase class V-fold PLP-dependent enzyme [Niabella sp. CC-SYL272]|uniref:cysteine desulfurase family protein n=1 Tax=Niabella agricola TaxID=2891571 RepID=UPI001F31AC8E|nr:aminotransferase class V-fold PLP-dependent enzyme [Niabella agricola]MCF3110944.1 aminotransferase class V-fold PLP-dependent enzyme [Niabella agricola]
MLQFPIYLDNCATTACDTRVVEAMLPYFTQYYGNASSRSHAFGWKAQAAVETAQQQVAALIGAEPGEIIFTSGATESCNLALRGICDLYAGTGRHIITVKTEHKAVLDTCRALEKKGTEITYLDVDVNGQISLPALEAAIKSTTILIAVMWANNETGVILPINEIGAIARKHQVLFFSDATQAAGKVPVNVKTAGLGLMAFSSHKLYGPKGAGALYVSRKNPRARLIAQITGGGQQEQIRSGTLNVPGIVGFGKAAALCREAMPEEALRLGAFRDQLETALLTIPDVAINGAASERLPQICNASFGYLNSNEMLSTFNKDLAVSSGSACTSGSLDPSYVLKAMQLPDARAKAAIRFSCGRYTTAEEIDHAIRFVREAIHTLRMNSPAWQLRD